MKPLKAYWQLAVGLLIGSLGISAIILIWLSGSISLDRHGMVVVTDFPKGIKRVHFEHDLVNITVINEAHYPDFQFKPVLLARCKDREYGSITGITYKERFIFHFDNISKGIYRAAPINDIHKVYPSNSIKEAQQAAPSNR